jgi:hypothetical protein
MTKLFQGLELKQPRVNGSPLEHWELSVDDQRTPILTGLKKCIANL